MKRPSISSTAGKANPQRKTAGEIRRTGPVRMLGADSRLAANDEDAPGVGSKSTLYRAFVDLADARDERNAAIALSEQELIEGDRELAADKVEWSDQRALALQVQANRGDAHAMGCYL